MKLSREGLLYNSFMETSRVIKFSFKVLMFGFWNTISNTEIFMDEEKKKEKKKT